MGSSTPGLSTFRKEPEEVIVEGRAVVRDVEIEWFSPVGEGEEREPVPEPDEENEWREESMKEHDDWNDEIPTVLGDHGPTTPDEPSI